VARGKEQRQPCRDIVCAFPIPLRDVVIRFAVTLDPRRQAVEALRAAIGTREQQVTDRVLSGYVPAEISMTTGT
jgi:hypothetical protein